MRKYNGLGSAIRAMEYESHLLRDELKVLGDCEDKASKIYRRLQKIYIITRVLRMYQNKD
jgi:hypothetical protein